MRRLIWQIPASGHHGRTLCPRGTNFGLTGRELHLNIQNVWTEREDSSCSYREIGRSPRRFTNIVVREENSARRSHSRHTALSVFEICREIRVCRETRGRWSLAAKTREASLTVPKRGPCPSGRARCCQFSGHCLFSMLSL